MQENKRGARGAKGAKTTGRPRRVSLRIAMTLPAALHLEAKREASSLSMSFSEYMRSLTGKIWKEANEGLSFDRILFMGHFPDMPNR